MPVKEPYPELDELIEHIGEAGQRLSDINASEGAAGNISVYAGWEIEPRRKFPLVSEIELPIPVPGLAGGYLLVTGSGRRLRDISKRPRGNLGIVKILPGGLTGLLYRSTDCLFEKLTSELNSHLAIHLDQVTQTGTNFHAVIHAQPPYLTFLSHIPQYQDLAYLNEHLLRWQPEIIVQFPEGIGFLPFLIPSSQELMSQTSEKMRLFRLVIWGKHGVIARSDQSVTRVSDRIEYAETGAHYEYMCLLIGGQGEGLSKKEIADIRLTFGVPVPVNWPG
jgi:rhamnulose-1-phosphate aldolase